MVGRNKGLFFILNLPPHQPSAPLAQDAPQNPAATEYLHRSHLILPPLKTSGAPRCPQYKVHNPQPAHEALTAFPRLAPDIPFTLGYLMPHSVATIVAFSPDPLKPQVLRLCNFFHPFFFFPGWNALLPHHLLPNISIF